MVKWIDAHEHMPIKGQSCIVYRCDIAAAVPSNMYWDGEFWVPDGYGVEQHFVYGREDISHWMPLPEPPK